MAGSRAIALAFGVCIISALLAASPVDAGRSRRRLAGTCATGTTASFDNVNSMCTGADNFKECPNNNIMKKCEKFNEAKFCFTKPISSFTLYIKDGNCDGPNTNGCPFNGPFTLGTNATHCSPGQNICELKYTGCTRGAPCTPETYQCSISATKPNGWVYEAWPGCLKTTVSANGQCVTVTSAGCKGTATISHAVITDVCECACNNPTITAPADQTVCYGTTLDTLPLKASSSDGCGGSISVTPAGPLACGENTIEWTGSCPGVGGAAATKKTSKVTVVGGPIEWKATSTGTGTVTAGDQGDKCQDAATSTIYAKQKCHPDWTAATKNATAWTGCGFAGLKHTFDNSSSGTCGLKADLLQSANVIGGAVTWSSKSDQESTVATSLGSLCPGTTIADVYGKQECDASFRAATKTGSTAACIDSVTITHSIDIVCGASQATTATKTQTAKVEDTAYSTPTAAGCKYTYQTCIPDSQDTTTNYITPTLAANANTCQVTATYGAPVSACGEVDDDTPGGATFDLCTPPPPPPSGGDDNLRR